jgi:hypothetical protein
MVIRRLKSLRVEERVPFGRKLGWAKRIRNLCLIGLRTLALHPVFC